MEIVQLLSGCLIDSYITLPENIGVYTSRRSRSLAPFYGLRFAKGVGWDFLEFSFWCCSSLSEAFFF